MKENIIIVRIFQIVALLSVVSFMCLAAFRQPEPLSKRIDRECVEGQWNRDDIPDVGFCVKRVRELAEEETYSFAALYGLAEYDIPEKNLDFDDLRSDDNPHIYAWLTIPDTIIDYPVVQHPDQPDYYLTHNLDGSAGYPGCIYTQPVNSRDWTDNHTVIYGHNMRNGTMFAGLHAYEEKSFFEENPYVYIYTEDSVRVYRIFAAYPFSDEHLLLNFNTETQQGYEEYLQLISRTAPEKGHYDAEAAPENCEPVITLSTCVADRPAQRYLVQAALEAEGTKNQ